TLTIDLIGFSGTFGSIGQDTFSTAATNSNTITHGVLIGDDGNNLLDARGFAGSVTLDGGAGNDVIDGGAYDDILTGGPGHDTIDGGGTSDQDTLVELANGRFVLSYDGSATPGTLDMGEGISEVQTLTLTPGTNPSGTFNLGFNGEKTAP